MCVPVFLVIFWELYAYFDKHTQFIRPERENRPRKIIFKESSFLALTERHKFRPWPSWSHCSSNITSTAVIKRTIYQRKHFVLSSESAKLFVLKYESCIWRSTLFVWKSWNFRKIPFQWRPIQWILALHALESLVLLDSCQKWSFSRHDKTERTAASYLLSNLSVKFEDLDFEVTNTAVPGSEQSTTASFCGFLEGSCAH